MIKVRVIKEGGAIRELSIPGFVWNLVLTLDRILYKLILFKDRFLLIYFT